MLVFLLLVLGMGLLVSLLPFLYPGAVVAFFGLALNQWLAELLGSSLGVGRGTLVTGMPGSSTLTLSGVLALYLPAIVFILLVLRGR